MPRNFNYHIPASRKRARSPGASYCGLTDPYKVPDPLQMRRWVVEMAQLGKASQFCHRCLAGMLEDANAPLEAGIKGARRRNVALTPEQRLEIAHRALEARWSRYRLRKAIEARAGLAIVPPPPGAPNA